MMYKVTFTGVKTWMELEVPEDEVVSLVDFALKHKLRVDVAPVEPEEAPNAEQDY